MKFASKTHVVELYEDISSLSQIIRRTKQLVHCAHLLSPTCSREAIKLMYFQSIAQPTTKGHHHHIMELDFIDPSYHRTIHGFCLVLIYHSKKSM